MTVRIRRRDKHRKILFCRTFRDLAAGIKCRSVARAVKRVICLGGELAFSMGAVRGKRNKLSFLADDEKTLVTKCAVNAVRRIVAHGTGVHHVTSLRSTAIPAAGAHGLTTGDCGSDRQIQEMPAVHSAIRGFVLHAAG